MPGVEREEERGAAGTPSAADTGTLNLRWAEAFVAALVEAGVRDIVVAPGSRSAPLAFAIDRAPLRTHIALDERAGAFFALGLAKGSRRPAAVLCTSGTAAANFFPAILEAAYGRVPLIALTADRPPELRDTGAPQTVDQLKLFGSSVRWFCEVGTPDPDPKLLAYVGSLGARAVAAAWGPPSGPVHLNFAFREPLVPPIEAVRAGEEPDRAPSARGAMAADRGEEPKPPEGPHPSPRAVERMARLLRGCRRGLIVCGPEDAGADHPAAMIALAEATGYPILADPLSQLRYGPHDRARILGAYDLFLRSPEFARDQEPEAILHFGAAPTSKGFARYAERHPNALHLAVDPAGAWRDPRRRAREVLAADSARFARALADALARTSDPLPGWGDSFARAEAAARAVIARRMEEWGEEITEPGLFPALIDAMHPGAALFAGNSMPVRDLDSFAPGCAKPLRVLGNRGVNGIDGLVSTALGTSASLDTPLLAVVGDLSFHHDLTGLAALREGRARATIVVVNNDGGGIFSFLPVAEHERDLFERYFGTPHGLDFEPACALYRAPHARPASIRELRDGVSLSLRGRRTEVFEIRTDRARNVALHRAILEEAARAVEKAR